MTLLAAVRLAHRRGRRPKRAWADRAAAHGRPRADCGALAAALGHHSPPRPTAPRRPASPAMSGAGQLPRRIVKARREGG